MTDLDKALEVLRKDMNDPGSQSKFFDIFLNTTFFVPTLDDQEILSACGEGAEGQVLPLVIELDGNDYLMLFDSKERMQAWAQAEVESVEVPGYVLASTTRPPLHWALNAGSEYSKQFLPDEITWLRDVVERCSADAAMKAEEMPLET